MSTTQQAVRVAGWAVEARLPELSDRLVKVNRQARKLGSPEITYTLTGAVEDRVVRRTEDAVGRIVERKVRFVEVVIEGAIPVLPGGWELVAVVNHEEGLPIVKNVPGRELPAGQRERGAGCDQCGYDRERKDTFVVQDTSGAVKQVGRNCLADFLGMSHYSPEALLALVTFLRDPIGSFGDPDDADFEHDGFRRGRITIDVTEVVMISGACIDENGWVSRGRAQAAYGAVRATAGDVSEFLFPPKNPPPWLVEARARLRGRFTTALKAEAEAAIEWAKAYEGHDDYPLNLKVCASREVVGYDKFGLVVSLIASYRREQEQLRERERKSRSSAYIGTVGKREVFTLTLVRHSAHETAYGTSHRCEFETGGATVVWWASNDPTYGETGWRVGEQRTVKATPKKHEEFRGVLTTVVTRVAEVKAK